MKKCLLLCFWLVLLTGCAQRYELSNLAVVSGVAYDKTENGIEITMEIAGEDGEKQQYIRAQGASMEQAYSQAYLNFDKQIFLPHIKVHIISEELAKEGVESLLRMIQKENDFRMDSILLVAKEASAGDFLASRDFGSGSNSYYLSQLAIKSEAPAMKDFFEQHQKGQGVLESVCWQGELPASGGIAVFQGDRLQGFFGREETRGYHFIQGQNVEDVVQTGEAVAHIMKSSSKKKVEYENGSAKFIVNIHAFIRGASEEKASQTIKQEAVMAVKKAQEWNCDIFGFGQRLYAEDPNLYREIQTKWAEIFSGGQLQIDVDARTGGW